MAKDIRKYPKRFGTGKRYEPEKPFRISKFTQHYDSNTGEDYFSNGIDFWRKRDHKKFSLYREVNNVSDLERTKEELSGKEYFIITEKGGEYKTFLSEEHSTHSNRGFTIWKFYTESDFDY